MMMIYVANATHWSFSLVWQRNLVCASLENTRAHHSFSLSLVGPTSTSMLTGLGLEFLVDRAYLGIHAYNQLESLQPDAPQSPTSKYTSILKIILFALLAIEKFSHTSESKYILLQSLTVNRDQNRSNLLEYYEPWAQSKNCFQRQIGRRTLEFHSDHLRSSLSLFRILCSMVAG